MAGQFKPEWEAKGVKVHESAYVDDPEAAIGKGTRIWHFSHILASVEIGEGCSLGQNVVVGPKVTIGANCKIQNNVSIYEGVTLEDEKTASFAARAASSPTSTTRALKSNARPNSAARW